MKVRKTKSLKDSVGEFLHRITPSPIVQNSLSVEEKKNKIENHFQEIMKVLGLDLSDDSLKKTPKRISKMFVDELFYGLDPKLFPSMTLIENKMKYNEMVCVQDIELISTCEHHFLPIQGLATVAYIPQKSVIGLSKLNRIVDYFSRRPQVQERLTRQIADCIQEILQTKDVAVYINARHYCVVARGVQDTQSTTVTTDFRGVFKTSEFRRNEFLDQCRRK